MNNIIQLVAVLFMLSMICERVAELFKNKLSASKIGSKVIFNDLLTKFHPGSREESLRQYRILKLNLTFGFMTAFMCHASLFEILKNMDDPGKVIGWPDSLPDLSKLHREKWLHYLSFFVGCFLTGAFISLGSKFWHDLLDVLVEVKNVKRSVADITQVPDFSLLGQQEQFQLLSDAIRTNKDTWKNNFSNYSGVSVAGKIKEFQGDLNTNQLSLRFNVTKKEEIPVGNLNRIPEFIFYKGYKLPTDVLTTGEVVATGDVSPLIDETIMPRPLGCSIGRSATSTSGTLGLRVKLKINGVNIVCGVSCYHVLFPEELKKKQLEILSATDPNIIGDRSVVSPSVTDTQATRTTVGNVMQGFITPFMDISFFQTTEANVSDIVFDFGKPDSLYFINTKDENTLDVKICGRTSGHLTGKVMSVSASQTVTYFKDEGTGKAFTRDFDELIQIQMKALKGDSGSALLTTDNKLVGIVMASDGNIAYAVPVRTIQNNFSIFFDTFK